jgi:hypothetical protein
MAGAGQLYLTSTKHSDAELTERKQSLNVKMAQNSYVGEMCIYTACMCKVKISPATRHGGAWGERRYSSCSFSTSELDGGEWSASRPGRAFTPGTHWTGGWVGPRAGLDTEARGEIYIYCNKFAGSISQWKFTTLTVQYTTLDYSSQLF